jgi:hypothetical protein
VEGMLTKFIKSNFLSGVLGAHVGARLKKDCATRNRPSDFFLLPFFFVCGTDHFEYLKRVTGFLKTIPVIFSPLQSAEAFPKFFFVCLFVKSKTCKASGQSRGHRAERAGEKNPP